MARIEVEIEEYLDEVNTKYLVQELKKRKDFKSSDLDLRDIEIPRFKSPEQKLCFIKLLLGLRPWHDKERIISEIKSL